MGGIGSGWQGHAKRTVESALRLDVRGLQRDGVLRPGRSCTSTWTWHRWGEKQTSSIGVTCLGDCVRLHYRDTTAQEDFRYTVPIERTPNNYGGERAWFRCPNTKCNRRCRFLFHSGRYYVCRQCAGLTYRKRQVHRDPSAEARAAGVSFWDADERWLDWRKDPIRRLRYRLARTRPGSKNHQRIQRRLQRLRKLQEAEQRQAEGFVGRLERFTDRFTEFSERLKIR